MRHVRMKVSAIVGNRWVEAGKVVAVADDHRAARLVELKHAEHVAAVAVAPEGIDAVETDEPPRKSERATERGRRERSVEPR